MPISHSDHLFSLIKSLSKSEKKSFTVYASRLQDGEQIKYIQLFELIDKSKVMDDEFILSKMKDVTKSKYSNLKRHLYSQILVSLKLIYINKKIVIEVREHIDFADILYTKGLIIQSLKILNLARNMAIKAKATTLELIIIEKLKKIESRNITRSGADKVEELTKDAARLGETVHNSIRLSNLKLTIHGYYIKHGHVNSEEDFKRLHDFYEQIMPDLLVDDMTYFERIYLYQTQVWYNYILLNFTVCFENALKWINLMQQNPNLIEEDPDLLMRGYHYLLTSAYYLEDKDAYSIYLNELIQFRQDNYKKFSHNSQIVSFLYVHHGRFNYHFLHKSYDKALEEIPKTLRRINKYREKLDEHRIMVLLYKIAFTYLMTGNYEKSIKYLHTIMIMEVSNLREDIQAYTRLMFIMAHFSAGNEDQLAYLVASTKTFFKGMTQTSKTQIETLDFFTKLVKTPLLERASVFAEFKIKLSYLKNDFFEKRAFLYIDIMAWLEMKNF